MAAGVLLAVRGDGEADLAAAITADPGLFVSRRCADLVEALGAAEAGVAAVALVSRQPHLNRNSVQRFLAAGVNVVGYATDAEDADAFRGLGIVAIVQPSEGTGRAAELLSAVAASADEVRGDNESEVVNPPAVGAEGAMVAVWGPVGAPGRTTLAIEIAHEAAAHGTSLLVDADTYGASVAQRLGLLDESPGVAAVARAALDRVPHAADVLRHALTLDGGVHVLTGLSRPSRWPELSAAALDGVWSAARETANTVVVDCGFSLEAQLPEPGARNAATISALGAADVIVIVGLADPIGVHRLVAAIEELAETGIALETPRFVVINRVRKGVAGRRPSEAVADALVRYAGVPEVWPVGDDPIAADHALVNGRSWRETAPDSAATFEMRALAEHVVATAGSAVRAASIDPALSVSA